MTVDLTKLYNTCEKACFILQKTRDGDDLDPGHLWLVQEAVNGHLNEKGEDAFEELYQSVIAGYIKPWLHGVEHLTKDHQGYVYWKGHQVEHYSFHGKYEEEKVAAEELGRRCRILEAKGILVSCTNAIWKWDKKQENGGY